MLLGGGTMGEKVYIRGRTVPPAALGSWNVGTPDGQIRVTKAIERHDGSCRFIGVFYSLDGGCSAPVRGEVTRAGSLYFDLRD